MGKTPGIVLPAFYSSLKELEDDIRRRDKEAGFTPLDLDDILHYSFDDVEAFLAHYGVRGMRWGTRKSRSGNSNGSDAAPRRQLTKGQKRALAVGGVVALGTAAVVGKIAVDRVLGQSGRVKMSSVPKIKDTSPEHKKFIAEMMKKQYRLNASANSTLKTMYERNQTPIHARDYLPILPGQRWGPATD